MGNLNSMFVLMIAYLYTDFLYIYYYERILGLRYSRKVTFIATFCMWVFDCTMKLFPQYLWGMDQTGIVNLIMLSSSILYAILFYNSSIIKRFLSTAVYMVVQVAMDLLGMQLATMIVGERELFETIYVIAATVCSGITITLGTVVTVWIWKKIEEKQWEIDKYQWCSFLLPISQYAILQHIAIKYMGKINTVSIVVATGILLGLLGDIYMFWLFERNNARKRAEEELRKLEYQYELEQVRYTVLLKKQEEISKLRHDFQNYVLTMKVMK